MHKYWKIIITSSLIALLLGGGSFGASSNIQASSWNWTKAFSLNRALKNSDRPNEPKVNNTQKHHQVVKLYSELRAHHFSPDTSLAFLTLVHINDNNYLSTNVRKNYKLNNGYLGFNRALNSYLLTYTQINHLNPNHLATQAEFMLKFYGMPNIKSSHKDVSNLVKTLSDASNMDTQLATKATDNDIHNVLMNLK